MSKQRTTGPAKSRAASKSEANQSEKEVTANESESAVAVGEQATQPTVTIDGKEYTLESLGQQGREQLQNLRVTDQELQRLQDQLAITQTARNTYARILAEVTKSVTPVK
ncbi:DUF6447 family protein [Halomonas sp. TD01]|uniref:DUF6447 family protein n=1 Tax=Halomonas sp. TD01 TaxID=999141 RepID=UPI000214E622|nr:DUF6447 family protein [Halomonas sp. TD01]EGP18180.1 hypothetical protein GME_17828 [Halomonas sp. TD01]CAH1043420.1 hypothetical protein HPTD01_1898 [Halomonas sp. TD01]